MCCVIFWNLWVWCGGVVLIKVSRNLGVVNEGSNYVCGLVVFCRVCLEGGDGYICFGF